MLRFKFAWREDRLQTAIRVVAQSARVIIPRIALKIVAVDPDDDKILECAVYGKADIIVSNDHHLLDLKVYANIPIGSGPTFRRTLGLR